MSNKYSERDYTMAFFRAYAEFLKLFFFSIPFLVLVWYGVTQVLDGAPEPQWWVEFEALAKAALAKAIDR